MIFLSSFLEKWLFFFLYFFRIGKSCDLSHWSTKWNWNFCDKCHCRQCTKQHNHASPTGSKSQWPRKPKPLLNVRGNPIVVIQDVSHIVKLVRNAFAEMKIFYMPDGSKVAALHRLQTDKGRQQGQHWAYLFFTKRRWRFIWQRSFCLTLLLMQLIFGQKNLMTPYPTKEPETKRKKPTSQRVIDGQHRRGFLGFIVDIISFKFLFSTLPLDMPNAP